MASWRVAPCLNQLLNEINGRAPHRRKAADGSIGDTAHSARKSDHNPDSRGIVHARDFTHDPDNDADMNVIYRLLVAKRDRRIKYIIWNDLITSGEGGPSSWVARGYSGSNEHRHHLHLSVKSGETFENDVSEWLAGEELDMTKDELIAILDARLGPLEETLDNLVVAIISESSAKAKTATGKLGDARGDSLFNLAEDARNNAAKAANG